MIAASPATLHLLAQVLFVTSEDEVSCLAEQQPDTKLQQPYAPLELTRLKSCKRLLIAMEARLPPQAYCTAVKCATSRPGKCCSRLIVTSWKHEVQWLCLNKLA